MQMPEYNELQCRAAELVVAERQYVAMKLEAHARVSDVITAMQQEGKALVLTDEEIKLLHSFRSFKAKASKAGVVFKWQTSPVASDVLIVEAGQAVHITDPKDVSDYAPVSC